MRTLKAVVLVLAIAILPGCASIVTGHNQSLSVQTPECEGAKCTLTNSKGTWYVQSPGSVIVHRAYGDMTVTCEREGFPSATSTVPSTTKAMAFGNIIFGGVIGVGVDVGTGAAYDYPDLITNPMACKGAASKEAAAGAKPVAVSAPAPSKEKGASGQ